MAKLTFLVPESCDGARLDTLLRREHGVDVYKRQEHLRILEIEGACPDQEAILSGRYPLTRPFLLLTKSENQNPLVRDFLSFATGEEGCAVLEKLGLIPGGNAAQGNGDMESGN